MNISSHCQLAQAYTYYKRGGSLEIPPPRTFQDVCLLDERSELLARVRDLPERVRCEVDKVVVLDNQPGQDRNPSPKVLAVYSPEGLAAMVDNTSSAGRVGIQHYPDSTFYARESPDTGGPVEYLIATRNGPQVEILKYRDLGSMVDVSRHLGSLPEDLTMREWLLT